MVVAPYVVCSSSSRRRPRAIVKSISGSSSIVVAVATVVVRHCVYVQTLTMPTAVRSGLSAADRDFKFCFRGGSYTDSRHLSALHCRQNAAVGPIPTAVGRATICPLTRRPPSAPPPPPKKKEKKRKEKKEKNVYVNKKCLTWM